MIKFDCLWKLMKEKNMTKTQLRMAAGLSTSTFAKLTKNEMGILRLLMVNKGNIIPRDAIIDDLWQSEEFIDENTLNVNIVRLRKTLAEIGLPDYLETKRGLGYLV